MIIRERKRFKKNKNKNNPNIEKEYLEKKKAMKKRKEEWDRIDESWEGEKTKSKIFK